MSINVLNIDGALIVHFSNVLIVIGFDSIILVIIMIYPCQFFYLFTKLTLMMFKERPKATVKIHCTRL